MKTIKLGISVALLAWTVGCSGGGTTGPKDATTTGPKDGTGNAVSAAAANKFNAGLDAMASHDKANDWSDATCTQTAQLFLDAAKEQGDKQFGEALYNAGLSYQRCKKDTEAKAAFKQALDQDAKFHRARMQLALYAYTESGEKNVDAAITEMRQAAITDAQFKNVEALVHLANLYLKRNNKQSDGDGADDLTRAKKYLQSALAVDDGYMPAFNALGLYYLNIAKERAGRDASKVGVATNRGKQKRLDAQALELASLVCSQAIRKNQQYAPIHNTAGMIWVELGNLNNAVRSFDTARRIDPTFYEAQMNYAAVNLQFRGFKPAEDAYRAAIKMRPNDYDAHLGLALALRGQIDDSNFDQMVKDAGGELEAAKKIAPDRAEAYYNQGILTQEYSAKSGGKAPEAELNNAKTLFDQFIKRAAADPQFADAAKTARDRMKEIDQIIDFNKQTEAQRKAAEADLKQKQAEADAKGDESGAAGTPAGEGDKPKDDKPKDDKAP
jgi:hypothetical protein